MVLSIHWKDRLVCDSSETLLALLAPIPGGGFLPRFLDLIQRILLVVELDASKVSTLKIFVTRVARPRCMSTHFPSKTHGRTVYQIYPCHFTGLPSKSLGPCLLSAVSSHASRPTFPCHKMKSRRPRAWWNFIRSFVVWQSSAKPLSHAVDNEKMPEAVWGSNTSLEKPGFTVQTDADFPAFPAVVPRLVKLRVATSLQWSPVRFMGLG